MSGATKLVSYPKTGRTWLRLMIAKYLDTATGLDSDLQSLTQLTEAAGIPPIEPDHAGAELTRAQLLPISALQAGVQGKRVLFIARNFEDTLVSAYHQARYRKGLFDGSLTDFIASPRFGAPRLHQFYNHWAEVYKETAAFQLIWYEDMHRDPHAALSTALRLCGIPEPDQAFVGSAVEFCRFNNLQAMERSDAFTKNALRARDPSRPETYKFRRGEVGGFVEYLDARDLAMIRNLLAASANPFIRSGQSKAV